MTATERPPSTGAAPGEATEDDVVLRVRDLHTHFGGGGRLLRRNRDVVRAVNGVSFDVRRGEIFGLVGESGSGKTTLARTILGLVPSTSGHIWWHDGRERVDLAPLSERQFRPLRRRMSMVFQDPNASLNPAMTVAQGVGHPLRIHGLVSAREEMRDRVAEMLERCGLSPGERFLDTYPEDLSGGQKQRVVIARALICDPELVVADEPVAALDMSVRAKVLELMVDLQEQLGLTYLYITHDLTSARFVCDTLGIMYLGELVEWGDVNLIYDDPAHPYTDALLGAVPLPDPSRKGRAKQLPEGEIPDALRPPAGCKFHPRCPKAFGACGWEGSDLVQLLERRWTEVDADTFERELAATGPLSEVTSDRESATFHSAEPQQLVEVLETLRDEGESLFTGVDDISAEGGNVVVQFSGGPVPVLQPVEGRMVACHLHGIPEGSAEPEMPQEF